jgi:amino acid transporter
MALDPYVETPFAPSEAAGSLKRSATWKAACVISLGGSLLVAVSLGPMAAALGPASVFVWSVAAGVGVLQCLMITELAGMFPHKSGGTPTYAHEGFKHISPLVGAVSNWGYWLGWLPVIPVNLVLAAGYFRATFMPGSNDLVIAFVLTVLLFGVNNFGLALGVWSSVVMALCALGPLSVIALSPALRPALFHRNYIMPFVPLHGSWTSWASWTLMTKWMFVAVWSAYAFEAASTIIAEMKDPQKDAPKAMGAASSVGVLAYVVVPFMLLAIVGTDTLSKDPLVAFLPAASAVFGRNGEIIVSVMLIAALLLGAQTAIIGASRALFEMSRDRQTIKQFERMNKHGVPIGSAAMNLTVTLALLAIFRTEIVNLVAASNVGYLLPFMMVAPAFIILRYRKPEAFRPYRLPRLFIPLAALVTVFNWSLFFLGGFQWGIAVMATGLGLMLTFIPFYVYRRKVQDAPTTEP